MIGKLLLTLVVMLVAYGVIRSRMRAERVTQGLELPRPPLLPRRTVSLVAAILLAVMAGGSALVFLRGWLDTREVVEVQVINASTGAIITYHARRGAIDGRQIETLDGRRIRMADVERMIILPVDDAGRH